MGEFIWNQSSSILLSGLGVTISNDASGSFSVLTISSVMTAHAGTYTCGVTAGGVSETMSINITVECKYYMIYTFKSLLNDII